VAPDLPPIPDLDTGTVPFEGFDRALHAILGRATRAVSPTSLLLAYTDWMSHLLLSPAKQVHLVRKYVDPDAYLAHAAQRGSSWWPEWHRWLGSQSGEPVPAPVYGAPGSGYTPFADAPGTYVLEK